MRRTPRHLDLEMDEAAMRDRDPEIRRLRHDRSVGGERRRDRLRPDARELLVRDGGHDHVPTQATSLRVCRREHASREAPLHVLRATPVEPSALDARHERVRHAGDADRVHVRVQHQRAATTRAAGYRDDIGAARAKLRERRLEPRALAPLGDEPREPELTRAARRRRRD